MKIPFLADALIVEVNMRRSQKYSQGFSLIEVLVAVLIVGVGILGVAGMQVVSLQQNRNVLLRDQALQAANDILDRMRANDRMDYAPVIIPGPPSESEWLSRCDCPCDH